MKYADPVMLMIAFVLGLVASISLAKDEKNQPAKATSATEPVSIQAQQKKLTIKDIMKEAHDAKTGLAKKVATGKATATEKSRLQILYEELAKLSPPKGTAKDWSDKTTKLVDAAKLAVKNDPVAAKSVKAATNCKSCHKVHK